MSDPSLLGGGLPLGVIESTLGAMYLGVVGSCILFGISSLQVYLYFHFYPKDGLLYKSSVGLLWIFDALHIALSVYALWFYGVENFGTLGQLQTVHISMKIAATVQPVIIFMVQGMYTYRLWLLSGYHHSILRYLVTAVVLGGFGIGVVPAYETWTFDTFTDVPDIAWAVEASLSASSTIDILICVAMCYYLRKSKSKSSGSADDGDANADTNGSAAPMLNSRISQLIGFTLSCGMFTVVCSLACLVTFITMPDNLVFFALTFILTRLYPNSYVAMMNARRRHVRAPGSTGGAGMTTFNAVGTGTNGAAGGTGSQWDPVWTGYPPIHLQHASPKMEVKSHWQDPA